MSPPFLEFSPEQVERYSRQILLREIGGMGQATLLNSRVAVVGAGAIGSVVLPLLAGAGVGHLLVVDGAEHAEGKSNPRHNGQEPTKAEALAIQLRKLNPELSIQSIPQQLNRQNCATMLTGCQWVICTSPHAESRLLLTDWSRRQAIPLLAGRVIGSCGEVITCRAGIEPTAGCLACATSPVDAADPHEGFFSSLVAGIVGSMLAGATLKEILALSEQPLSHGVWFEAQQSRYHSFIQERNSLCPLCRTHGGGNESREAR